MAERDIDVGRRSRNFCWREDIAPKGSGPNVLSERVSRIGVIYLAQHVRALDLRDSLGRVSPSGRDSLTHAYAYALARSDIPAHPIQGALTGALDTPVRRLRIGF